MIYGERVRLRALEVADLPYFVTWLNDPDVQQGLLMHNPFSQAEEENWYQRMLQRPVDQHAMGIEVRQPGEAGKEGYWDLGYGTEAVQLLVKHGFETLNLNRIYLHVFEINPRAIRAYEKAGFTLEGRERQAEFRNGRYIDVLRMSMLKAEFSQAGATPV
jgi:diamine N-acetyltransferase